MNQDVTNLQFSEKFANENEKIKRLLFDFQKNKCKYIIKNSTGVGATTTMANYTGGNLIILSPNNSMIKSKEGAKYDCDKFLSIYGKEQKPKWSETLSYLKKQGNNSNIVINTNPEQLLLGLSNEDLNPLLKGFNVFIDESHSYFTDNSYRPDMGRVLELIYNEFHGGITLSTATPIPFNIDIPEELPFKYFSIERKNNPTKHLQYSEDIKDRNKFIIDEVSKGRKVAVFSNNKNIHNSEPVKGITYKNLVGDNLRIKLQPYGKGNNTVTPDLFNDADVFYLSSSYFAGFDLPVDTSILIISEQKERAYTININDAVQAYGRCRKSVHNALYINHLAKKTGKSKFINYPKTYKSIKNQIDIYKDEVNHVNNILKKYEGTHHEKATYEGYANRGLIGANLVNEIHDYYQFNESKRLELFKSYNFQLTEYKANAVKKISNATPFKEQIINLYGLDCETLFNDYYSTKNSVKYKDIGSFNYKSCLYYLSTFLIKKYDIKVLNEMLDKKRVQPQRFFKVLNNWIYINYPIDYLNYSFSESKLQQLKKYKEPLPLELDEVLVRDWHFLYGMFKTSVNVYDEDISRYLNAREQAANPLVWYNCKNGKKNRVRNTLNNVVKTYNVTDNKEKEKIREIIINSFKRYDALYLKNKDPKKFNNLEGKKVHHKKVINALIQLWHNGGGNYTSKANKNREYGAITDLPGKLRKLIPLEFIELDITSANPQFVDKLINSNNAFNVYENIMNNKQIDRSKAKVMFNTYLNNSNFTKKKAYDFYLNVCGYTINEARQLANKTAGVGKGDMFEEMTEVENSIINNLSNYLDCNTIRLHDALLIPSWEVKESLPLLFENIKFHIGYFNNTKEFKGETHEVNERVTPFLSDVTKPISEADKIRNMLAEYNKMSA